MGAGGSRKAAATVVILAHSLPVECGNTSVPIYFSRPVDNTTVRASGDLRISFHVYDSDVGEKVELYLFEELDYFAGDKDTALLGTFHDVSVTELVDWTWTLPSFIDAGDVYSIRAVSFDDPDLFGVGPSNGYFSVLEAEANLLWLVGILMSILASVCSNLGVNVQKYSLMGEAMKPVCQQRSYLQQKTWVIGLLLVIFGSLGDFAALGFAPQSLITPVGGLTMVFNILFAHYWLGESLSRRDIIATTLVVVGIIVLAVFASKSNRSYTLSQLVQMYLRLPFVLYACGVGVTFVMLYSLVKRCEKMSREFGTQSPEYQRLKKFHPFCYSALSGVLGAQSILFAKSTAELFKSSMEGSNQFVNPSTYLIVLCMFVFIFSQIHWLTVGLKFFDAVYVVPVFQCFFISTSIIGGGIYFREMSGMSVLQFCMFLLGVCITLYGVLMLSERDMTRLKPLSRFRKHVHCILFVIRLRKLAGKEGLWDFAPDSPYATPPGSPKTSTKRAEVSLLKAATLNAASQNAAAAAGSVEAEGSSNTNTETPQPGPDPSLPIFDPDPAAAAAAAASVAPQSGMKGPPDGGGSMLGPPDGGEGGDNLSLTVDATERAESYGGSVRDVRFRDAGGSVQPDTVPPQTDPEFKRHRRSSTMQIAQYQRLVRQASVESAAAAALRREAGAVAPDRYSSVPALGTHGQRGRLSPREEGLLGHGLGMGLGHILGPGQGLEQVAVTTEDIATGMVGYGAIATALKDLGLAVVESAANVILGEEEEAAREGAVAPRKPKKRRRSGGLAQMVGKGGKKKIIPWSGGAPGGEGEGESEGGVGDNGEASEGGRVSSIDTDAGSASGGKPINDKTDDKEEGTGSMRRSGKHGIMKGKGDSCGKDADENSGPPVNKGTLVVSPAPPSQLRALGEAKDEAKSMEAKEEAKGGDVKT